MERMHKQGQEQDQQKDTVKAVMSCHLLKHAVEMHGDEDHKSLKFGMKAIKFTSHHLRDKSWSLLLNSRSEFNRCAVPRIVCKLGDKTFKKNEKEIEADLAREDAQISKIRVLIK